MLLTEKLGTVDAVRSGSNGGKDEDEDEEDDDDDRLREDITMCAQYDRWEGSHWSGGEMSVQCAMCNMTMMTSISRPNRSPALPPQLDPTHTHHCDSHTQL